MDIIKKLAEELAIKDSQVKATVDLIDEGNTIPFISRYRKEATGGLSDEVLRTLDERLTYLRGLEERKATVVKSIEEQGKMTPELMKQIEDASTLVAVEDLYRPYKPKRRTRATVAKEKGLEPLAQQILAQEVSVPLEQLAEAYVSEEKGVASAAEAQLAASMRSESLSRSGTLPSRSFQVVHPAVPTANAARNADESTLSPNFRSASFALTSITHLLNK